MKAFLITVVLVVATIVGAMIYLDKDVTVGFEPEGNCMKFSKLKKVTECEEGILGLDCSYVRIEVAYADEGTQCRSGSNCCSGICEYRYDKEGNGIWQCAGKEFDCKKWDKYIDREGVEHREHCE